MRDLAETPDKVKPRAMSKIDRRSSLVSAGVAPVLAGWKPAPKPECVYDVPAAIYRYRKLDCHNHILADPGRLIAAADLYGKPVGFVVASIQHFVDCVVNDQTPLVMGEDGLAVARVLAAEQSAQTGLPVTVA